MKHENHTLHTALESRILHGLACEWEAVQWVLDTPYQGRLKKPFFSLKDLKKTWGYWSGEKKEICLSRKLVYHHTWNAVREVLLHEMAHQFSEQVFHAKNESPHGKHFLEACRLLRANPKASGQYHPLPDTIGHPELDSADRLMVRIRKLLALAESRNRFEAEAAMVKAHELIEKYNIDLLRIREARDYFSLFIGRPALRHSRDVYHLAQLIQDFYFVEGIWIPAYVIEKGKMGRVLEISGTRQNLSLAGYVYDFVTLFIDRQWDSYNGKKRLNQHRKTDFSIGIIEGFREKLTLQQSNRIDSADTNALVKAGDPQLRGYLAHKYPRTVSFKRSALNQDETVVQDGKRVGKKLVIHKGISETSAASPRLIEDRGKN